MTNPENSLERLFDELPLGARFCYRGKAHQQWVKLEGHGCGLITHWNGVGAKGVPQALCSAAESEQERKTLIVQSAEAEAPLKPARQRPCGEDERMPGADSAGSGLSLDETRLLAALAAVKPAATDPGLHTQYGRRLIERVWVEYERLKRTEQASLAQDGP